MSVLNYQKINEIFSLSENFSSVSEVHGLICGFICAGNKLDGRSWLEPILGTMQGLSQELQDCYKTILLEIYQESSVKLQSFEFDFELLLPSDDEALNVRAEALSLWCQGFTIALNQVGISVSEVYSADAKEAYTHLIEISKLDYELIDISENDEKAYMEVMEYVRVAVLMVYSDLAGQNGPCTQAATSRLH